MTFFLAFFISYCSFPYLHVIVCSAACDSLAGFGFNMVRVDGDRIEGAGGYVIWVVRISIIEQ